MNDEATMPNTRHADALDNVRLSIPARLPSVRFVGEAWPTHRGRERTRKRKHSSIRRRTTPHGKSNPTAPRKAH